MVIVGSGLLGVLQVSVVWCGLFYTIDRVPLALRGRVGDVLVALRITLRDDCLCTTVDRPRHCALGDPLSA